MQAIVQFSFCPYDPADPIVFEASVADREVFGATIKPP